MYRGSPVSFSHIRVSLRVRVAIPLLLLATAACAGHSERSGDFLQFFGPPAVGMAAPGAALLKANIGHTVGYAFPEMRNTSSQSLRVESFKLLNVPAGVRVIDYKLLSLRETDGLLLMSWPVDPLGKDGYENYKDYTQDHPVIPPHGASAYYAVVYLKLIHGTSLFASGCEVTYRAGDRLLHQTGPCQFRFAPPTR